MKKPNKYRKILQEGNIGPLSKIVDLQKFIMQNVSETERIRVLMEFIVFALSIKEISVEKLIRELCLLEKALASEINGSHITISGKRYSALSI